MLQLDIFDENQLEVFVRAIRTLKDSGEKVRRGVFAEVGELKKEVKELKEEIKKIAGDR